MTIEEINELIVRMTENCATQEELAKVIEYSKYIIDAESVRKSNNVQELIDKYPKKSGRYPFNEENSENKKLKKAVSFIAELLMHTFEEGEITDSQRDALLDIAKTFE